jgi:tetratricopeptide (TPR) repeat protein
VGGAVLAWLILFSTFGRAQTNDNIPVAPPESVPAAPPAALPLNPPQPPLAPPVAPPLSPPADETNAAPTTSLIVVNPGETEFDDAMALFNAGQFAEAVNALSKFVTDFPSDRHREEALFRLASSYQKLGRGDDALAAYTFQVETYPDGPLRLNGELQRGALLFDAGKFSDATAPLEIVANQGDGQLQEAAKYLLGRSFLVVQKEADGRVLLQAFIDAQPPGPFAAGAAQALAELDDAQAKYPEAEALWQKVLALAADPAVRATAAARGGWSALAAKQPADAEKLFQTARQLDAGGNARKVATTGLLRLLFQQQRYPEWLALYTPDADKLLDSARAENLYDLGHVQFALQHWPESVAAFDQYLAAFGAQDSAVTAAYERFLALTQIDRAQTVSEAEAYLKAWPQSPYRARVELLEAQELSHEKNFSQALPLWETLAQQPAATDWPRQQILLELARTYDELSDLPKAATAYQAYLDDLNANPGADPQAEARQALPIQARLAVCLQKSNQLLAATEAWKAVQSLAPAGSPEQQMALESLGLIYARGGPAQEEIAVETFRKLLENFPRTPLRAMAAFYVGDDLFRNHDYAGAEPFLREAREADATTWLQPATQRLALGAFGRKDYDQAVTYLKEYDTIPVPTDPQAAQTARLPAAFFYWLAETARQAGQWSDAETDYTRVTQHPDPGDLLAGAWWQLGEVQSQRREWIAAVVSYSKYRDLKPDAANATTVLLALGRAELGAQDYDDAKKLADQALLQEPEGPNSAAARMLLGETAFAAQDYPEAAKMFATLALLFDDPKITPQATARAAEAFAKGGDEKSAAAWRRKLKEKYPDFQEVPYL